MSTKASHGLLIRYRPLPKRVDLHPTKGWTGKVARGRGNNRGGRK